MEILNENSEVVKLLEVENLSKVAKLGSKALLRADVAALFALTSPEDRHRPLYLLKECGFYLIIDDWANLDEVKRRRYHFYQFLVLVCYKKSLG